MTGFVPILATGCATWVGWLLINAFRVQRVGLIAIGALAVQIAVAVVAVGLVRLGPNDYVSLCVRSHHDRFWVAWQLGFVSIAVGGLAFATTLAASRGRHAGALRTAVGLTVAVLPYVTFVAAGLPSLGC